MRNTYSAVIVAGIVAALAATSGAHADVVISSAATSSMACSNGVCAPTAKNAVLNVGDLENLLASGAVEVTTSGSDVQARNIEIDTALTWSSGNVLALDAFQSILVETPVSIAGQGGLSIATNDRGTQGYFGFRGKGHVTFSNLSSVLTVNGASYTLEGDIKSLAAAIAANSAGNYALANDFDASNDGTYQNSPIPTEFSGSFEGLGNTISNLSLSGTGDPNAAIGLFAELGLNNQPGGSVEDISLRELSVTGNGLAIGGLVGLNAGTISGVFVSGSLSAEFQQGDPEIGGLVGYSIGNIARSGTEVTITSSQSAALGGLASYSGRGAISQSFANCKISGGSASFIGGLVGDNESPVSASYATGSVQGGAGSDIGGLVGNNVEESTITQSYSKTILKDAGHKDRDAGGLIGVDNSPAGSNKSDYWDTSTSRVKSPKKGAGTPQNDRGITGLTNQQLQSGLPDGFDPKVWAEDPKINGGFPYLINNPPRK
ncbi:MAG TPA: hypothetical protein VHY79_00980 [Rhizomicrobium sp.]|jgi:hypothetical protein|nr:hypothetical protein [Rhizomicrobium sp.]